MAKGAANARRYFLNQQFSCLGTHRGSCSCCGVCVRKKSPSKSGGRGFEVDRESSCPIRRSASSQSGKLLGQENQGAENHGWTSANVYSAQYWFISRRFGRAFQRRSWNGKQAGSSTAHAWSQTP